MSVPLRSITLFWWLLTVLLVLPGRAQVPGVTWASGGGTPGAPYRQQAQGSGVVTDAAGNTYVTGIFRDTLQLGATRLATSGNYDIYVAKLDAVGRYQWATQAGGNGWDISNGVALDASGNVYITGYVESARATFGTLTLANPSYGAGLFVAKLSPTGTWLRVTSALGPGDTYTVATALAVDAAGAVYVTGGLRGAVQFGATTLPAYGGYSTFVAKLDAAGTWQWAVRGGQAYDFGNAIALDGAGNVYITGSFESQTATFGLFTLTNTGYNSADLFVAKLDAAGRWQWVVGGGSNTADNGRGIAVDGAGNAYVTGSVAGTAPRFGAFSVAKPDASLDVFVAKLNPAGAWQWITLGGGPGIDGGAGIALDPAGNPTVAGSVGSPTGRFGNLPAVATSGAAGALVAQLDAAGNWRWALGAGGAGSQYAAALATALNGEVRIIGTFEGRSATFGATTLSGGAALSDKYFADCLFVANVADLTQRSPAGLTLWPNPSHGTVWATGLDAGQPVQVFDSLGRLIAADARPAYEAQGLVLLNLSPGVYIVRCGAQARRFTIY